ncbi:MAG: diacylglycerol/lipid kinase family protein [Solirubrobacteraceae bacterium]
MTAAAGEALLERVAALERPAQSKRMLVIVNPYATTMSDRLKHLVVYALQGRYDVEAVDTQRRGHAIELCRDAAAEHFDVVVAFGGDGTVNEAANGLAGSRTALTCLPGGSNNVFCKMLGIPNDVVDATEHLLGLADRWEPGAVDLGRVNGRWFTFAAGMGLDASVVERVDRHPHLKARFGAWYYTEAAVVTFLRRYVVGPPRLEVEVGGERVRGVSAFFQNGEPYTYFKSRPVNLVEGARLDSGDLAGVVLTRARPYDVPTVTFRALSGAARIAKHRGVRAFAGARQVRVRSVDGRPVPLQVDGDHVSDETVAELSVAPGALRVIS